MSRALPGEVAWYVTGRFYATGETLRDAGYFVHLQGIAGKLFPGDPGEGTARFTFLAEPFRSKPLQNGSLSLGLDPAGEFTVYLNETGGATFDDPASFGAGEPVARFRRVSVVMGTTVEDAAGAGLFSMNVFSAALVWSSPFAFEGRRYDFRRLLPHGITQWGTASATPADAPAGFISAVPFVGSAIAVGGRGWPGLR